MPINKLPDELPDEEGQGTGLFALVSLGGNCNLFVIRIEENGKATWQQSDDYPEKQLTKNKENR